MEAKDERTVTIKTSHPYSLIAERLSVVKIVPKAASSISKVTQRTGPDRSHPN